MISFHLPLRFRNIFQWDRLKTTPTRDKSISTGVKEKEFCFTWKYDKSWSRWESEREKKFHIFNQFHNFYQFFLWKILAKDFAKIYFLCTWTSISFMTKLKYLNINPTNTVAFVYQLNMEKQWIDCYFSCSAMQFPWERKERQTINTNIAIDTIVTNVCEQKRTIKHYGPFWTKTQTMSEQAHITPDYML